MLALLAAACIAAPQNAPDRLWFMYFLRGNGARPTDQKAQEDMQTNHIANLKRLFGEHKLIAAGPLADPTQERRGVCILTVPNHVAIADCYKNDPYVRAGLMKVQAFAWDADRNGINVALPDPDKIAENRFAVFTAINAPSAELLAKHRTYVERTTHPSIGGPSTDKGAYREFYLYSGPEDAKRKAALEADPLVKSGALKLEFMPLWMAKGSLK